MTNQSYYRIQQFPCSIRSDERPIIANCAGSVSIDYPFTTDNREGRRDYYLMYIVTGSMDALVNGKSLRISTGDAIIFEPEKPFRYTGKEKVEYYWVHFTGSDAKETLRQCGLGDLGVFHIGKNEMVTHSFKLIIDDFIRDDATYQISAAAHLTSALAEISRLILSFGRPAGSSRIEASIRFIHQHFDMPIHVSSLAEMEFLSVPQYNLLFRRYTGKSPLSYIIELRISNSCEMLLSTDLGIKQIAHLVGYDDPQYFSRIFKKYRGVSPEGYRKH